MRLPSDPNLRHQAVIEISRQCMPDRASRQSYHAELFAWFSRGTSTGDRAIYNRISAYVNELSALIYAPEATRFSVSLDRHYGDEFVSETETLTDYVNQMWHERGYGLDMAAGVKFASVYPSIVFKVVASEGQARVCVVPDPADIGVLEPDKPFDRQEAILHVYSVLLSEFDRIVARHPYEEDLKALARNRAEAGMGGDPMAGTVERMVFDAVSPEQNPVYGGGALVDARALPSALVEAPRVVMAELWVVDDKIKDWRVITGLAPDGLMAHVIWDRRTPVMPGCDPFVKLGLNDALHYTWGFSGLDDLAGLQDLGEERLADINQLMKLQLKPPKVLGGFGGLSDERAQRLNTPGGVLATSMPKPTVENLSPVMPPEAFASEQEIGKNFAHAGGLPIIFSGQTDPSIRAGDQLGVLATLSSARPRQMSMAVERAVSKVATLVLRLERELDGVPLKKPDGSRFLMRQVPRDLAATVDAHSSSPLFAAAIKATADDLIKTGSISRPDYVRLKNPPGVDQLVAKAREIQRSMAEQAERMYKLQVLKVKSKATR